MAQLVTPRPMYFVSRPVKRCLETDAFIDSLFGELRVLLKEGSGDPDPDVTLTLTRCVESCLSTS